jgi:hypothetical protein
VTFVRRHRLTSALVVLALGAAACSVTIGRGTIGATPTSASASASARPSVVRPTTPIPTGPAAGPGSALAAMRRLCVPPTADTSKAPTGGTTPTAIQQVEHEVQSVRGLTYVRPVVVQAITPPQMHAKVSASFNASYPAGFYARRTLAWRALGVIPPTADIRAALLRFQTGEVVGFYNPDNGELVYIGDPSLTDLAERFTLAHELTHAIDDQHFHLARLDALGEHCQAEGSQAALGAVEGSAQYFASQVITQFPGGTLTSPNPPSLAGVPPFIVGTELWPYTAGQTFITALRRRGGLAEVNAALQHLPVSTAQVIHPERYPSVRPVPVNVPELARRLGPDYHDIDVMTVGEQFLDQMFQLRLDDSAAAGATDGWAGGIYRAWSNGPHTAVVLATAWTSPGDAQAFAQAMQDWLDAGDTPGAVLSSQGTRVVVGFSDDPAALAALR